MEAFYSRVTVEGNEDHTVHPVTVAAIHKKYPSAPRTGPVTPEDIAGIFVPVDGNEDYTIRPRPRKRPSADSAV